MAADSMSTASAPVRGQAFALLSGDDVIRADHRADVHAHAERTQLGHQRGSRPQHRATVFAAHLAGDNHIARTQFRAQAAGDSGHDDRAGLELGQSR